MEKLMAMFEKFDLQKIQKVALFISALGAALQLFMMKMSEDAKGN